MSTQNTSAPVAAPAPASAPSAAPRAPSAPSAPAASAAPAATPRQPVAKPADSVAVKTIMARLERYVTTMAPGQATPKDTIAGQQKALYNTLRSVLLTPEHVDFVTAFGKTISMFAEYGDAALGPRYVARGHSTVKLDMTQRRDLAYWTNIFIVLSRPRLRKSVTTQIDFLRAFESLPEKYAARVREHIRTLIAGLRD